TITTAVEPNGNNREPLAGCLEATMMPPDCAEETNRSNIFSGGVASGDRADATARHLYKTNAAFILEIEVKAARPADFPHQASGFCLTAKHKTASTSGIRIGDDNLREVTTRSGTCLP